MSGSECDKTRPLHHQRSGDRTHANEDREKRCSAPRARHAMQGQHWKKKPHCTSAITKRHEDTPRDRRSPKLNHTNNRVRGPRTTLPCSAEGLWVAGSEGQQGWLALS